MTSFEPPQDVKDRYTKLAKLCDTHHIVLSFTDRDDPNYQEILTLGKDGLRCLLLDLAEKDEGCHWRFSAVYDIARELGISSDSFPMVYAGKVFRILEHILAWGIKHQFIDPENCVRMLVRRYEKVYKEVRELKQRELRKCD